MLAQRSFEDLGTPLAQVTFCVVDLETTGGSAYDDAITEIGALKVRCGQPLGSFQTLVDPGRPVPAFVRLLTGIGDDMLVDAPGIASVLPSFLEFLGGSVLVAHNARFDAGFLNAALHSYGYEALGNTVVDTARLARKILGGEVPNHRLETLTRHLRCAHRPNHRAFPDVLATVDLLHHLIERAAGFGVTTLEDLAAVTSARLDGTFRKIELAAGLPRGPGIYRFLGRTGETLYVGKATDIRSRVRSYFYGDPRRRIRDLLRATSSIAAERFASMLEAEIAEARAIAAERPPYNRAGKRRTSWYLKLALKARAPRLSAARVPKTDGSIYLGPFASHRIVASLIEAVQDAAKIHRCNDPAACRGCGFGALGTCLGQQEGRHRAEMLKVARGLLTDPSILLQPLHDKMSRLAEAGRYEDAAVVRDRGSALERALRSFLDARSLLHAGDIVVADGTRALHFSGGRLIAAGEVAEGEQRRLGSAPTSVLGADAEREMKILMARLRRADLRLLYSERGWRVPVTARPRSLFEMSGSGPRAEASRPLRR